MIQADHPRIRGEHIKISVTADTQKGSSPHTRGAHRRRTVGAGRARIIPAYAGSTSTYKIGTLKATDHPRIRGEHETRPVHITVNTGSSPHTRGALLNITPPPSRSGIIPAYAGSTLATTTPPLSLRDHPRIRGEHARDPQGRKPPVGSSPHTRGAHRRRRPPNQNHRIIPAYAGST